MSDNHGMKNMELSEKVVKQRCSSITKTSSDSTIRDNHGHVYLIHDRRTHDHRSRDHRDHTRDHDRGRHDHRDHDHHGQDNNGEKQKSADLKNQKERLSKHRHKDKPNYQKKVILHTQDYDGSDIEDENSKRLRTPTDLKYKIIQEYSLILDTINEQNKYLEKMKDKILSAWAQSERQGLESLFCEEQGKLASELKKAMSLRPKFTYKRWPETPAPSSTSDESCDFPAQGPVASGRQAAGAEMPGCYDKSKSKGNEASPKNCCNNAHKCSSSPKGYGCCCSTHPTPAFPGTGVCQCRPKPPSTDICCYPISPILFPREANYFCTPTCLNTQNFRIN